MALIFLLHFHPALHNWQRNIEIGVREAGNVGMDMEFLL